MPIYKTRRLHRVLLGPRQLMDTHYRSHSLETQRKDELSMRGGLLKYAIPQGTAARAPAALMWMAPGPNTRSPRFRMPVGRFAIQWRTNAAITGAPVSLGGNSHPGKSAWRNSCSLRGSTSGQSFTSTTVAFRRISKEREGGCLSGLQEACSDFLNRRFRANWISRDLGNETAISISK